jgi:hypothetical protein
MYQLASVYLGKLGEAKAYIASKGEPAAFDADVLSALVSTKQITLAISLLNELKRTNPEYTEQVDAYIKQLLASPAK